MRLKYPAYQIVIILVIIPVFYTIRNHFQIIPSINSILPSGVISISNNDFFMAAWLSIVILHWISLTLVFAFLKINNYKFIDIGYSLSLIQTLIFIFGLILIGLLFYFLKTKSNFDFHYMLKSLSPALHSKGELLAWIFLSINAGFCEEIVYRGFGINSLKTFELPRLIYYIIPIVSWISIHNLDTFSSPTFGIIFLGLNGFLFTGLYLWRKNLNYSIGLHVIANLTIILI
ncbi:MAG: CPBP family intramembrane glutamic endopeptidase [Cyclobacteriaceae bacterium]